MAEKCPELRKHNGKPLIGLFIYTLICKLSVYITELLQMIFWNILAFDLEYSVCSFHTLSPHLPVIFLITGMDAMSLSYQKGNCMPFWFFVCKGQMSLMAFVSFIGALGSMLNDQQELHGVVQLFCAGTKSVFLPGIFTHPPPAVSWD